VEQQFTEFATLAAPRLRRTAFLLCGDWHTAEDLAQTALAKVFLSWRRISRRDAVQAYATRTLMNSYRRSGAAGAPRSAAGPASRPRGPGPRAGTAARGSTPSPRSAEGGAVVLRYWEDLSVEQVACSAARRAT
jgi:DNA-directed RNA polymerase specialized sigma24 family protein